MGTWKFAYLAIGIPKENTHFTVGFGIAVEELQVVIIQKKKELRPLHHYNNVIISSADCKCYPSYCDG